MKYLDVVGALELKPVIEIFAGDWSQREFPSALNTYSSSLVDEYLKAARVDAGIDDLIPIQPGSNFFDAFHVIQHQIILRLLRSALDCSGMPGFPNDDGLDNLRDTQFVSMLAGGYAFCDQEKVLLEPGCCIDFSCLDEFFQLLEEKPQEQLIWLGHPMPSIQFEQERVTINERCNTMPFPDDLVTFSVSIGEFEKAMRSAERKRNKVSKYLLIRVRDLIADAKLAVKVTDALMGKYS